MFSWPSTFLGEIYKEIVIQTSSSTMSLLKAWFIKFQVTMNRTKVKQSTLIIIMESSIVKSNHNYKTYESRGQQNELLHAMMCQKWKWTPPKSYPWIKHLANLAFHRLLCQIESFRCTFLSCWNDHLRSKMCMAIMFSSKMSFTCKPLCLKVKSHVHHCNWIHI